MAVFSGGVSFHAKLKGGLRNAYQHSEGRSNLSRDLVSLVVVNGANHRRLVTFVPCSSSHG